MKIVDKLFDDCINERNIYELSPNDIFKYGYQAAILEILSYDQELKKRWNYDKFIDIVTIRSILDHLSREVED